MSIDAMKQALEAMEELHRTGDTQVFDLCYAPKVIPALRLAIEQAERLEKQPTKIFGPNLEQVLNSAGFYKRQPLTEEEIREISKGYALGLAFPYDGPTTPEMFARAIERAHGIGGEE